MIQPIMYDPLFLAQKSAPATPEDAPAARDLLETLTAHADGCVGMAANMIGVLKRIIAVEFSLDNGEHWTRYDLGDTTADRWVSWTFAWTPEASGAYQMKVRSVNEDGDASPIAAVHTFEVL